MKSIYLYADMMQVFSKYNREIEVIKVINIDAKAN